LRLEANVRLMFWIEESRSHYIHLLRMIVDPNLEVNNASEICGLSLWWSRQCAVER
jgi:hypothetical protein